jgi:hypothetical protein
VDVGGAGGNWYLNLQYHEDATDTFVDVKDALSPGSNIWMNNVSTNTSGFGIPGTQNIAAGTPLLVYPKTRFIQSWDSTPTSGDNVQMQLMTLRYFG